MALSSLTKGHGTVEGRGQARPFEWNLPPLQHEGSCRTRTLYNSASAGAKVTPRMPGVNVGRYPSGRDMP